MGRPRAMPSMPPSPTRHSRRTGWPAPPSRDGASWLRAGRCREGQPQRQQLNVVLARRQFCKGHPLSASSPDPYLPVHSPLHSFGAARRTCSASSSYGGQRPPPALPPASGRHGHPPPAPDAHLPSGQPPLAHPAPIRLPPAPGRQIRLEPPPPDLARWCRRLPLL